LEAGLGNNIRAYLTNLPIHNHSRAAIG